MAAPKRNPVGPFAVSMDMEFLDRLGDPVRTGQAKSVSEIIRTALEHYDFSDVMFLKPAQVMISVRLPVEVRQNLKKLARAKQTSVGQLVRAAVEAYLPQLEAGALSSATPAVTAPGSPAPAAEPPSAPTAKPANVSASGTKTPVRKKSLARRRNVPKTQRAPQRRKKSSARKKSR